ncbi:hypothetical protein IU459_35425 [Nocardia amamiensis]|uniref:Uncharacterized protein n=1 Tax=Nocardia amamiensis TaxID=404578 RepID=A0ABS0D1S8_9NOCA|nr:hypothetical protein [Nocardia amamiensis]MBF6302787.1 hypothetical protein [Nocardia amamiensis]
MLLRESGATGEAAGWIRSAEAAEKLDRAFGVRIFPYTEDVDGRPTTKHTLIDQRVLLHLADSSNNWLLDFPAPLRDLVVNSGLAKAMHNRMLVEARRRDHAPDDAEGFTEADAARIAELLITPRSPTAVQATQQEAEPTPADPSVRTDQP